MLVLHGYWSGTGLGLWAEDSELPVTSPSQALRTAREHLEAAQAHAALNDGALDLLAEELRLTHNALGTITGAFSADDLLGEIFTRFCIGK